MTVKELAEKMNYRVLCMPDESREVMGGYAGDLLSWVMGRMQSDCAWITIMSNVNIIAVSALTDPACIILSENVEPDQDTLMRAVQQGVNLLSSPKDTFSVCTEIGQAI